jgi:glycosyl transferase family 25
MRTFVINLKQSQDRRAHIAAQLDSLGVQYEFFEAIEGPFGITFFSSYDERRYLANTGRVASPTEAACFASHASLWKRCAASGAPIVVLEDDAAISPSFPEALRVAERSISQYGFIRLQKDESPLGSQHVESTPVERHGALTLSYCKRVPFGAMAYAISPKVATRFLAKSAVLTGPVDLFIKKFWEHGQPVYALEPGCVRASHLCVQSTIEQREKRALTVRSRLMRALIKLDNGFSRARFNLTYRAKRLDRTGQRG